MRRLTTKSPPCRFFYERMRVKVCGSFGHHGWLAPVALAVWLFDMLCIADCPNQRVLMSPGESASSTTQGTSFREQNPCEYSDSWASGQAEELTG